MQDLLSEIFCYGINEVQGAVNKPSLGIRGPDTVLNPKQTGHERNGAATARLDRGSF